MKIRTEMIGKLVNHQSPNGVKFQFTIKEEDAEIYKALGLDVFENVPVVKATVKVVEVVEEVVKPKKNATKKSN